MRVQIVAYVVALLALCVLDAMWLSTMLPVYRRGLGGLLAAQPDLAAAVLFYPLYAAGVVVLAVRPGDAAPRWTAVAARGALLGLVAYGTYDLTNRATLRDWPLGLTLLDMAWGTLLTTTAATLAATLARRMGRGE